MCAADLKRLTGCERQRKRMPTSSFFRMAPPLPKFSRPPAAYEAIIREHQENPLRMGEFLLACGWNVQDAVHAVADWDLYTLAVAIANEQAERGFRLSPVPAHEFAKFVRLVQREKKHLRRVSPRNVPK